jgi:FKBP-type peptidyl-prolyl cis-trans isomerase
MTKRLNREEDGDGAEEYFRRSQNKPAKGGAGGAASKADPESSESTGPVGAVGETDAIKAATKSAKKLRQKAKKAAIRAAQPKPKKEKPKPKPKKEEEKPLRKYEEKKARQQQKEDREWKKAKCGVEYYDKQEGKGPIVVDRKTLHCSYIGRGGFEDGKVFDRSADFSFRLGKGEVIKGWDIGLQGMKEGGTRVLRVPRDAAYGTQKIGEIAGSDLFFEICVKPTDSWRKK